MKALFPIFLRLDGRKCLVVGAGRIAASKAAGLLRSGAKVTVVAPKSVSWIRAKAKAGQVTWHQRSFLIKDLKGCFLAVAGTDSVQTNHKVFQACQRQGVLCNVVDDPEYCDFFYPAVVRRGFLQIAISTSGQSPALAARIRRELEKQFGKEWTSYVEEIGKKRRQVLEGGMGPKSRRELLMKMANHGPIIGRAIDKRNKTR